MLKNNPPLEKSKPPPNGAGRLSVERGPTDDLIVRLNGDFLLVGPSPDETSFAEALAGPCPGRVILDGAGVTAWDTALLLWLRRVVAECRSRVIILEFRDLPEGARRLLALAEAVPPRQDSRTSSPEGGVDNGQSGEKTEIRTGFAPGILVSGLGEKALTALDGLVAATTFLGETLLGLWSMVRGRARYRGADFLEMFRECGPAALPIVTLISVLVGLILAFVGAIQLRMFGAEIYVANLVGLGMTREMGAMMAAIIMAGRTGAAFAAQLGTMRVNEEIDALETLGLSPVEFLVLPRLVALVMMMPLLCVYANVTGVLGGALVAVGILDIPPMLYWHQTQSSVGLTDVATGMIKSVAFGFLVALAGCYRGITCGSGAADVGRAATSAVVTSIVFIVVVDALFTLVFNRIGW